MAIDYRSLIRGSRINGRLYRDPAVFADEENLLWSRVWVYVGHESEVGQPGDFVRRRIGSQPVIMVRAHDGSVRVFFNRCRHRANLVCHENRGNAAVFKCPYHAWTYKTTGELIAPTFESGYDERLQRSDFALTPLPRVDAYRGLVFASASPSGISLAEHLGGITEYIDLFMDLSPTGEIALTAGMQSLRYQGNWKMMPENSMEGDYHGPFLHRMAFEFHSRRTGLDITTLRNDDVPDVIRYVPGGHMVEDYRKAKFAPPARPPSPARTAYAAQMEARYGPERAHALMNTTAPLIYIFPNLIYVMTHLRVVQPVSAEETFVYAHPVMLAGAPSEINEERLRMHEFMFGPAGFIQPDDLEIMERNQVALDAQGNDWLFVGRGDHRDQELADGGSIGYTMDENHIRGFWKYYGDLMTAGTREPALRGR
jgi:phenylpropionate dioxygenase-like ring-hydroxylating dioxygenase large terminal subunit